MVVRGARYRGTCSAIRWPGVRATPFMRGSTSRLRPSFVASLLVLACNENSAEPMQGETGDAWVHGATPRCRPARRRSDGERTSPTSPALGTRNEMCLLGVYVADARLSLVRCRGAR